MLNKTFLTRHSSKLKATNTNVSVSGMTWANQYLEMNHMGTMILCIGSSTGGLLYDYIPGYLYEYYDPESLFYVEVFYGTSLLALVISMTVFVRLRPKRTKPSVNGKLEYVKEPVEIVTIGGVVNKEKLNTAL